MSDNGSPRRESIIRAVMPAVEFRSAADDADIKDGHLGVLRILFSPVNEWTEIRSAWEGNFMERFASGAWKKTIRESVSKIRSLFQHGMDPHVGDKPIGPIQLLEENERGGYGEVAILDTSYNRDLLPGLRAGLYGASHRFRVMREAEVLHPERSEHNPDGIRERTIKEAQLLEFGPVTFGAYEGATAGVRSMTDEFLMSCIRSNPEGVREMLAQAVDLRDATPDMPAEEPVEQDAPSMEDAEPDQAHLSSERREDKSPNTRRPIYGLRRKETSKPWLLGQSKSTKRI